MYSSSRSNSFGASIITKFGSSSSSSPHHSQTISQADIYPKNENDVKPKQFSKKIKQKIISDGIEDKENINNVEKDKNKSVLIVNLEIEETVENISEMKVEKSKNKAKKQTTATKLPGRQTNNSLSSLTGNIVIQPVDTSPVVVKKTQSVEAAAARKKKVKSSDV